MFSILPAKYFEFFMVTSDIHVLNERSVKGEEVGGTKPTHGGQQGLAALGFPFLGSPPWACLPTRKPLHLLELQ